MADDVAFDTLVDACLALSGLIDGHGPPSVQAAYRVLLYELAREVARRLQVAAERS